MFGVMLSRFEITTDRKEDLLLQALANAMHARGFTLLGVVALHEEDGSLVTLGNPQTTQSMEFAGFLRCLADQIELNQDEGAETFAESAA